MDTLVPNRVRMSTLHPTKEGNVLGTYTSNFDKPIKQLQWFVVDVQCPYCDVNLERPDPQPRVVRNCTVTGPEVDDFTPTLATVVPADHVVLLCRSCKQTFTTPKSPQFPAPSL